jgi:hypothetical protein
MKSGSFIALLPLIVDVVVAENFLWWIILSLKAVAVVRLDDGVTTNIYSVIPLEVLP